METRLLDLSNELADAVARAAPSVVQVRGGGRPASGLVYDVGTVVTSARALGGEEAARVRGHDSATVEAQVIGWDPATNLAVLKAAGLAAPAITLAGQPARVGQLALAVARSWSNAVTASHGIVSVIGGPLRTGPGRAIDEVIRTSAPMHEGFAGGAFIDVSGSLVGLTTASAIRGLGVVIPAAIAWRTAKRLVEHGTTRRGYLGLAGQPVRLSDAQRQVEPRDWALLVVSVTPGAPAASGGIVVGDLILDFDARPVASPEDLLGLLASDRVGRDVTVRILRGTSIIELTTRVADRSERGGTSRH